MTLPGDLSPYGEPEDPQEAEGVDRPCDQPESLVAEPDLVACWRCGLPFAEDQRSCPVCRAKNRSFKPGARPSSEPTAAEIFSVIQSDEYAAASRHAQGLDFDNDSLRAVFKVFLILLATSIIQGMVLLGMSESVKNPEEREQSAQALVVFVEVVDSIVVLGALFWIGRPPKAPSPHGFAKFKGVITGTTVMAVAFGANVLYHHLLRLYIFPNGVPEWAEETEGPLLFTILTTLVQPAIIEELFFRYLVLDNLRAVTSVRAAVWISSVAFGMAHLGNPVGIPVLIGVGFALGLARVWSGSLWLPMALHALHNALVTFL
ncbi:MAG TPA: type II CAAX endopeptidase family protein [Pirellulales bacterium]|jgi:membrane protease YdiL (CAAX protease family)